MKNSNEFMLLFRFEPNFTYVPSEEDLAQMKQQWGAYIGGLAISEKLVSTHSLGFEGKKVAADKSVSDGIFVSESLTIGGNMIVKAKDIAEAVEIAKGSPILLMGGNVEIRSINPM